MGRLDGLVLARDGGALDFPLYSARVLPVKTPKLRTPSFRTFCKRMGSQVLTLAILFTLPNSHATAQGCAQCLDSTRATPPQVQAGYRHAIYLLGGAGATFFLAGLALFRRER
jgi:hypothetical protein